MSRINAVRSAGMYAETFCVFLADGVELPAIDEVREIAVHSKLGVMRGYINWRLDDKDDDNSITRFGQRGRPLGESS